MFFLACSCDFGSWNKICIDVDHPVCSEDYLKQIEAEINSGFAFVAAARKAYQGALQAQGDAALNQALSEHAKALRHLGQSKAFQIRSLSDQISELREIIDWLHLLHCSESCK